MANEHSNTPPLAQQPQTIPLSQIHDLPGIFNPKPQESKLGSMILSIQNSGVMEPVILRQRDDGQYQLLSGYRRRRASELAKKTDIPAFVYEMTMQEAIAYCKAVKENPKTPIPGKLVDPTAKSKGAEKPTGAVKDEAKKDGTAKDGNAPAAPIDKAQTSADKGKPDQPDTTANGKGAEAPAEAVKDEAKKDETTKGGNAPTVPDGKAQTSADKGKPDQPDAAANGKDGEKPAEDKGDTKKDGTAKDGTAPTAPDGKAQTATDKGKPDQPDTTANGKGAEAPAEAGKDKAKKDETAKGGDVSTVPDGKAQTSADKGKPDQSDSTAKGKDGEKPSEDKGDAKKDDTTKGGESPTVPDGKAQTAADKGKPDQPDVSAKGKGAEVPAENKGGAEHKPTVAEIEARANAGERISLSELAEAQKREAGKGKPKGILQPSGAETQGLSKGQTAKKAEAPAQEAAVKGSASTAIKQVLEDRLAAPDEAALKSIPAPGDGESIFVTLHPAYLEKSPLNTFSVDTESENFKELCKSIELVGIKDPVLARFNSQGKLEILSGQRRHLAATRLNRAVPTIIQKIDDADAKILVADGNLHRDKISSYDMSRALRMKMEGMKQKAGRRKKGYAAAELQSDAKLAQEMGMSIPKLNRYIHLSEAVKGVCDLVDDGKLTVSVASEIAYLRTDTQKSILHLMDLGYKPTNERIQRIKRVENGGKRPDEMTLRSILDDKDIAPRQQPQTQAPQQTGTAAQPAPAAEAPQPSNAPAPETIPASPDVAAQTPSGADAPAHTEPPTAGAPDAAKLGTEADPFEGKQERPEETKIVLKGDRLRKYFPDVTMTPRAIEESVYSALEERRQRQLKEQQKNVGFKRGGTSR